MHTLQPITRGDGDLSAPLVSTCLYFLAGSPLTDNSKSVSPFQRLKDIVGITVPFSTARKESVLLKKSRSAELPAAMQLEHRKPTSG